MSHTGSTVPAIAQDGPSTESGRDKHTDELLQSRGAAFVSSYTFTAIKRPKPDLPWDGRSSVDLCVQKSRWGVEKRRRGSV